MYARGALPGSAPSSTPGSLRSGGSNGAPADDREAPETRAAAPSPGPTSQASGTSGTSEPSEPSEPPPSSPEDGPPSGRSSDGDPSQIAQPPLLPDSPKGSLLWRIRGMIRLIRPAQWVKNLFVLAPVVFAKNLTHPSIILSAVGAFGVFCLLAGAVYTLNDLVDAPADRVHPKKRERPIASGRVPASWAKVMVVVLVTVAMGGALLGPWKFALVAGLYFAQNIAYSFKLKKIAYLDVGIIALGFVLRVLAGGFATKTPLSGYMIACTALLALFLGFGKRRHELAGASASKASKQREALSAYSPRVLTTALALTGIASVGTYLAYTLDAEAQHFFKTPYLWVTTIHPLFGILRFLQLVVGRPKSESPTQEMLRDTPFVLNLVVWVIEVVVIVYRLRPS